MMAKLTRKERRHARKMERQIESALKRQQPSRVFFQTVAGVTLLPDKVVVEGTDKNGLHVTETLPIPEPRFPKKYSLTTGEPH